MCLEAWWIGISLEFLIWGFDLPWQIEAALGRAAKLVALGRTGPCRVHLAKKQKLFLTSSESEWTCFLENQKNNQKVIENDGGTKSTVDPGFTTDWSTILRILHCCLLTSVPTFCCPEKLFLFNACPRNQWMDNTCVWQPLENGPANFSVSMLVTNLWPPIRMWTFVPCKACSGKG